MQRREEEDLGTQLLQCQSLEFEDLGLMKFGA